MSRGKIQPGINAASSLRKQLHECQDEHKKKPSGNRTKTSQQNKCNIVVAGAKELCMSKLAEEVARLARTNRKATWKAVHECKLGTKIKKKKWHSNYPTGVIKTVATFTHHAHIVMR
jgi:hypothetical protein